MPHSESKKSIAANEKKEIAARLKVTRLALGSATQTKIAKMIGITEQRWNNYESGRDRLTLNVALDICRKFPQVTLDWLYRGDKSTLRVNFSTDVDESERMVNRLGSRAD